MRLEDQVASLELCKRLKELGVKQESVWEWMQFHHTQEHRLVRGGMSSLPTLAKDTQVSAFTVAELGEILPDNSKTYRYNFGSKHPGTGWHATHLDVCVNWERHEALADTEADARAKMLIYLIEKGIVKP